MTVQKISNKVTIFGPTTISDLIGFFLCEFTTNNPFLFDNYCNYYNLEEEKKWWNCINFLHKNNVDVKSLASTL